MFVLYSCTENCSLNALLRPVAPSVVSGSPCSDDAGWMGAAAAAAITVWTGALPLWTYGRPFAVVHKYGFLI